LPDGCVRAEPRRHQAVGVLLHGGLIAVGAGQRLVGLKLRTGLVVVDRAGTKISTCVLSLLRGVLGQFCPMRIIRQ
jgi:hypothetical protein